MDNNTRKLIMAAKGKIPSEGVIDEVITDISRRINQAIMPVSSVTAPLVVAMLMSCAEEIKKIEPGAEKIANELLQQPRNIISVKLPMPKEW